MKQELDSSKQRQRRRLQATMLARAPSQPSPNLPAGMSSATFAMPGIRLRSRGDDIGAALKGSLELGLPGQTAGPSSFSELEELISKRELWICRVGTSHLVLLVSMDGHPVTRSDHVHCLRDWVKNNEVRGPSVMNWRSSRSATVERMGRSSL